MTESAAPHASATTLPPASANGSVPPRQPAPTVPRRRGLHTRISGMRTALIAGIAALPRPR